MKAIFLCDKPKNIESVYSEEIRRELANTVALDRSVFTKADLLASPDGFSNVDFVFSTWGMPALSEEEIALCLPSLKCVFYAAGSVQTFARPFLARGVRVFSAWAANAVPVAEYTVAQIVLANKGFFRQTRLMASGCLSEANALKGECLGNYNQRVGIIGCGMIGSMVAERLQGYELDVLTYDPFLSDERAESLGVRRVGLDELFSSCAVVSNHLANNAATRGMLKYEHFSALPHGATFINTGRGAQVVEEAGEVWEMERFINLLLSSGPSWIRRSSPGEKKTLLTSPIRSAFLLIFVPLTLISRPSSKMFASIVTLP